MREAAFLHALHGTRYKDYCEVWQDGAPTGKALSTRLRHAHLVAPACGYGNGSQCSPVTEWKRLLTRRIYAPGFIFDVDAWLRGRRVLFCGNSFVRQLFISLAWQLAAAGLWNQSMLYDRYSADHVMLLRPGLGFVFQKDENNKHLSKCEERIRQQIPLSGFNLSADLLVFNEGNGPQLDMNQALKHVSSTPGTHFVYWSWNYGKMLNQLYWDADASKRAMERMHLKNLEYVPAFELGSMLMKKYPEGFETCSASNNYCESHSSSYVSSHYCMPGFGTGILVQLLFSHLLPSPTRRAAVSSEPAMHM